MYVKYAVKITMLTELEILCKNGGKVIRNCIVQTQLSC
jgi:hypothetical protein